ncbi:hypothetical protein DFH08DRAFT_959962 [Mycena albidolilacea]|uniref:Uncharacterized protein n=1 Tax=Mycena albidolilacea TaxID=1033008 RepID=A0AAD7ETU4_9AGAR|nr:hypothetical protein DFH08DRAFT_959962 [Mycena albidolilacea]
MASPAADLLPTIHETSNPSNKQDFHREDPVTRTGRRLDIASLRRHKFQRSLILGFILARILLRASFQPHIIPGPETRYELHSTVYATFDVTTRSTYLRVPFVSVLNSKRFDPATRPPNIPHPAPYPLLALLTLELEQHGSALRSLCTLAVILALPTGGMDGAGTRACRRARRRRQSDALDIELAPRFVDDSGCSPSRRTLPLHACDFCIVHPLPTFSPRAAFPLVSSHSFPSFAFTFLTPTPACGRSALSDLGALLRLVAVMQWGEEERDTGGQGGL